MTSPDSVAGDERLRLFLALRLPEPVLDALEAWQAPAPAASGSSRAPTCTSRSPSSAHGPPASSTRSSAPCGRPRLRPRRICRLPPAGYRETRSVAMLVLDDLGGGATALAEAVQGRLEALGVYRRERRPLAPARHRGPLPGASAAPARAAGRCERLFRPTRLLIYHDCIREGRSTSYWNRLA